MKVKYHKLFKYRIDKIYEIRMKKRGKRGQITIFVVIALMIVAAIVVVFLVWNQLAPISKPGVKAPSLSLQFENGIKECVKENAKEAITELVETGGNSYREPKLPFKEWDGENYVYLCLNENDYEECVNQDEDLIGTFENGIKKKVNTKGKECIDKILGNAKKNGFIVDIKSNPEVIVDIRGGIAGAETGRVDVSYIQNIEISKGDDKASFDRFDVVLDSDLNLMLEEVIKIINSEAKSGTAQGENAALIHSGGKLDVWGPYPYDGSDLYEVKLVKENLELKFAARSRVLPAP